MIDHPGSPPPVVPLPRARVLRFGPMPLVMGILNVTPDSFSDGGQWQDATAAAAHGLELLAAGAAILDVGGESSRPPVYGAAARVDAEEEIRRVVPVIERLRGASDAPISVDTVKAEVARAALEAGADIVNDVSGLSEDPDMAALVAEYGVPAIVMHRRGTAATMQSLADYGDVVAEVTAELAIRLAAAESAGIPRALLLADPGLGFAKDGSHNLKLLARLGELRSLGVPLVVGASRKAFLGHLAGGAPPGDRLPGSLAAAAVATLNGAAILRVHDVLETARFLRALHACLTGESA